MKGFYFLQIKTYLSLEMLLEMSLGICKNSVTQYSNPVKSAGI